jgi:hypothetical protein
MLSTNYNSRVFKKILDVLRKKGGIATKDDIKTADYTLQNKTGGAAILDKVLASMVDQGVLIAHLHEAGNHKTVIFYRLNNGNATDCVKPVGNGSDDDINITCNLAIEKGRELILEAAELIASRIKDELAKLLIASVATDNGNGRNALTVAESKESALSTSPAVDTKESATPTIDDELIPFDIDTDTPSEDVLYNERPFTLDEIPSPRPRYVYPGMATA